MGGLLPQIERFQGVIPLGGLANAMLQQTKEMPVYQTAQSSKAPVYVFVDKDVGEGLGWYGEAGGRNFHPTIPRGSSVIGLGDPVEMFQAGVTPRQVTAHELGHFISITHPQYPEIRQKMMTAIQPQGLKTANWDFEKKKWIPSPEIRFGQPEEHIADILSGQQPRPDYYNYGVSPELHRQILELTRQFLR